MENPTRRHPLVEHIMSWEQLYIYVWGLLGICCEVRESPHSLPNLPSMPFSSFTKNRYGDIFIDILTSLMKTMCCPHEGPDTWYTWSKVLEDKYLNDLHTNVEKSVGHVLTC